MQTASCHVRLLNSNGPHKNEAFKVPVTPAEVIILRLIHGEDAVVNLRALGMDKREHRAELERLRYEYGAKVVNDAFPGHSPSLPVKFADIGIDLGADADADGQPAAKPRKSKAKSAEQPQGEDAAAADGQFDAGDGKYDPAIDGE